MPKIKLKKGYTHYFDADIQLSADEIIEIPEGWKLQKLLSSGIIEIIEKTKKKGGNE